MLSLKPRSKILLKCAVKRQGGQTSKRARNATQNTARQAPKPSHKLASHSFSINVSTVSMTSHIESNPLIHNFERSHKISFRNFSPFQSFGSHSGHPYWDQGGYHSVLSAWTYSAHITRQSCCETTVTAGCWWLFNVIQSFYFVLLMYWIRSRANPHLGLELISAGGGSILGFQAGTY